MYKHSVFNVCVSVQLPRVRTSSYNDGETICQNMLDGAQNRFVIYLVYFVIRNSLLGRHAVFCSFKYGWQLRYGEIVLNDGRLLRSFQSTSTETQWRTVQLVNELLVIQDRNSFVQFSDGTSLHKHHNDTTLLQVVTSRSR